MGWLSLTNISSSFLFSLRRRGQFSIGRYQSVYIDFWKIVNNLRYCHACKLCSWKGGPLQLTEMNTLPWLLLQLDVRCILVQYAEIDLTDDLSPASDQVRGHLLVKSVNWNKSVLWSHGTSLALVHGCALLCWIQNWVVRLGFEMFFTMDWSTLLSFISLPWGEKKTVQTIFYAPFLPLTY